MLSIKRISKLPNPGNGAYPAITGDGEKWVAWSQSLRANAKNNPTGKYKDWVRTANNAGTPLKEKSIYGC